MSHFSVRSLIIGITFAALAAGTPAAHAQVLDPGAYTSDGALSLASGSYTLDTDALTFNGYSGVLSNGIAVFDFSSINVGANATVNVIGSHPLALLSQSDATFSAGSSFNLNGGMGGEGQYSSNTMAYYPPGGSGGAAGSGGYSGGTGRNDGNGNFDGTGGGFGGGGGHYGYPTLGPTYGNLLTKLEGGMGGYGGGSTYVNLTETTGDGGGGGGGAIEINAIGSLTLGRQSQHRWWLWRLLRLLWGRRRGRRGFCWRATASLWQAQGRLTPMAEKAGQMMFSPPTPAAEAEAGVSTIQTVDPNGFIYNGPTQRQRRSGQFCL